MSFKKAVAKMAEEMRKGLRRNALSEDGRALAEAISEVVAEAENAEEEITAEQLEERIAAAVKALKPVEDPDPEQLAQEVGETENMKRIIRRVMSENAKTAPAPNWLKGKEAVRAFARCVRNAVDGSSFTESWRGELKKNGITGMAYPEQVEAAINTAWQSASGLFSALRHVSTKEFRILYSDSDTVNSMAHGHKVGADKKQQVIPAQGKKLSLQMVYKWLPVDRLTVAAVDDPETFISWVTAELTERLMYTIERTIVYKDPNASTAADAITSFEEVGKKTAADAFTLYYGTNTSTTAMDVVTLYKTLITASLEVNNRGRDKWLFINKTDLAAILTADFNKTGVPIGAGVETLADRLGVAKVIGVDYLDGAMTSAAKAGTAAVIITPDLYYRIGGDVFGDTWTIYEKNQQGYMSEVACGGGVAGLESTAVIAATSK